MHLPAPPPLRGVQVGGLQYTELFSKEVSWKKRWRKKTEPWEVLEQGPDMMEEMF